MKITISAYLSRMFSTKERYCLHAYQKISKYLPLKQDNLTYVHQMSFSKWRAVPTSGKILCSRKLEHSIPIYHSPQTLRFLHSGKDRKFKWQWSSGHLVYKAVFIVGAALVGGVVVKSKLMSVNADDDVDTDENVKSKKNNVHETEAFYTGGKISYAEAVHRAKAIVERKKVETGSPGISVAVSVDGKTVWAQGFGYADIENLTPCTPETILRIASISKPIAMVTVAKQIEAGTLDLDAPVQRYVPEFPEKTWDNKKVTITTRQLLSHLSGIRDYDKAYFQQKESNSEKSTNNSLPDEFLISKNYKSVLEGLELFKDDPLVHAPGSKFLYTSHGWTLISAVVEKVASEHKDFSTYLTKVVRELGMDNTHLEYQSPLVPNRGRYYIKNDKGRIVNAPFVDLSYKWAGGGVISNVLDVVKFGNAMLYSYQVDSGSSGENKHDSEVKQGYLKSDTVKMMWTPVEKGITCEGITNTGYGLGWYIYFINELKPFCKNQRFFVTHTGGAVGASSVLLILPSAGNSHTPAKQDVRLNHNQPPHGVVVAILANMLSVGLTKTAYDIAELFERVEH